MARLKAWDPFSVNPWKRYISFTLSLGYGHNRVLGESGDYAADPARACRTISARAVSRWAGDI